MEVKKLPMAERLQKIKDGYPAHAEFVPCAIWSFGNIPMSASVYKKYFQFYDMESVVLLAEMTDKAANFVPEKKAELLNLLFVQPFYYIAHMERSER